jgi:hypothetical protein
MDLAMFVPLYFSTDLTIASRLDRARKEDATESKL